MKNQTNYVKQTKTELKPDYDQMTNQRQDFYYLDAMQHQYIDKLGIRYPQDKHCDPYKQEHNRHRQENPK